MYLKKWLHKIGPGPLVAAAFIGPGTITLCSSAGVGFGYGLLWALLLSIIATISLQEMAARLGLVSRKDLAQIISELKTTSILKWIIVILVVSAILIGNTAYEAGNVSGGSLGLKVFFNDLSAVALGLKVDLASLMIGLFAFVLLSFESFKLIQNLLLILVILMSIAFVSAAVVTKPELNGILTGLFQFELPSNAILVVVGLIGTTVVPYNLFLHSALVLKKWDSIEGLGDVRFDTFLAVILGGVVSMTVVVAAASVDLDTVNSGSDLAMALEPIFGVSAKYLMGIGLLAAGLTSAITAPLAAAFVVSGLFGQSEASDDKLYKLVWKVVLIFGTIVATFNLKPIVLITFAQVANGIFLPVIALILIWVMNKKQILGKYTNTVFQNAIGLLVFLITLALSYRILITLF